MATASNIEEKQSLASNPEKTSLEKRSLLARIFPRRSKPAPSTSQDDPNNQLYEEIIKSHQSEYLILKVRKRLILWILGLGVVVMWFSFFFSDHLNSLFVRSSEPDPVAVEQSVSVSEPTIAMADVFDYRVRVRSRLDPVGAQSAHDLLVDQGVVYVEVVEDPESEYEGVSVITKQDGDAIRSDIETLLSQAYSLSSPSAVLTDDSDFDAVVLYGLEP